MEGKDLANERTISQITIRFAAGWTPLLFLLIATWLMSTSSGSFHFAEVAYIALAAFFISALSIPFGLIGGRIGKNWRKTQRAIINGVLLGTILGTILIGSCGLIILISVLPQ